MCNKISFLILCFSYFLTGYSQKVDERLLYLEQTHPSLLPEIFAPGTISKKNESEFGSVFNKEGTEFYYGVDIDGKSEIRYSKLMGDRWSEPKTILSHEKYGYNDPFLSPDEKRLYFISKRALDGVDKKQDYDIWYVEKKGSGWSTPINAGPNINSERNEYYISFSNSGTMYFSSNVKGNFDIYTSNSLNGEFQKAIALSDSVNTLSYEADVFVDPNELYIIFCADRKEGLGKGDLYISFKKADGSWTKSKNMGSPINSEKHELCPFVSKDGKYFFYTSNQDIYWVDARIIEQFRE